MNKVQELFQQLKARFLKLNKKERQMTIIFVIVLIVMGYYHKAFVPLMQYSKDQKAKLSESTLKLSEALKNSSEAKQAMDEEEILGKELVQMESQMLDHDYMSSLLEILQKKAEGLALEIVEISPDSESKKIKGYGSANFKIIFSGKYEGIVNYINRLEKFSDFLVIDSIKILEGDKNFPNKIKVDLALHVIVKNS